MTINQRIEKLLTDRDIDVKKIHSHIGMSSRMVKNYIYEDKVPSYIFLQWLFRRFKNLNPQWLFLEEGNMWLKKEEVKNEDNDFIKRMDMLEDKMDKMVLLFGGGFHQEKFQRAKLSKIFLDELYGQMSSEELKEFSKMSDDEKYEKQRAKLSKIFLDELYGQMSSEELKEFSKMSDDEKYKKLISLLP